MFERLDQACRLTTNQRKIIGPFGFEMGRLPISALDGRLQEDEARTSNLGLVPGGGK